MKTSAPHRIHCAHLTAFCCLALCAWFITPTSALAQDNNASPQLSVETIYTHPGLGASLTQGLEWSPNGKRLSFFQPSQNNPLRDELWSMDASNGDKSVLVDADTLSRVLRPAKSSAVQSTGLGRVTPESYFWSPDGNAMLFKSGGRLVWLDLHHMSSKMLVDSKLDIGDPKISPDGQWVSYLQNFNIWLVNIATGEIRQLTTGGTSDVLEGQLDWVYPEELDLGTAYWWSPDSRSIAFLQFDERPVTQYPIIDLDGKVETTRYPQAGEPNPIVRIGVASVDSATIPGDTTSTGSDTQSPKWIDTGVNTDVYIPRVDWVPDSQSLLFERLNRAQNKLELLSANISSGKSHAIITEQDKYWINVSDLPIRFFADGKRFLWTSERTGFCEIYVYNTDGKMLDQLTSGNWEVMGGEGFGPSVGNEFDLDEKNGYVYFISNKDDVLERDLYRVSLGDKTVTRVTPESGTHGVLISPDASAFVDTFSTTMMPPRQDLDRMDGARIAAVGGGNATELSNYHLSPVEFLNVKATDGTLLWASMIKPPDFDPAKKYPVLISVYGGPHAQSVVNAWGGIDFLWHEMMAEKGYIVFSLDNRGTYGRGHAFETPIYHHFGNIELQDQLAGVNYLKSLPYVDPDRIGIWGWSYGGFMTLNALFNAPTIFKAGVCVAPVSDWRLYDTIYTERYMGTPQNNAQGYEDSSPVNQAEQLNGKLLMAHGTGDDNVHFANTEVVLDRFIDDERYPDIVIFPGRGHPISDAPARILLFNRITAFLLANL